MASKRPRKPAHRVPKPKAAPSTRPAANATDGQGGVVGPSTETRLALDTYVRNVALFRAEVFRRMLSTASTNAHDIDGECGYPETITIEDYRNAYDREGVPARVVGLYPEECWQDDPEVYEVEDAAVQTPFELVLDDVIARNNLWHYCHRVDELSGIGHFGVMLLGLDDGLELDVPVPGINDRGETITVNGRPVLDPKWVANALAGTAMVDTDAGHDGPTLVANCQRIAPQYFGRTGDSLLVRNLAPGGKPPRKPPATKQAAPEDDDEEEVDGKDTTPATKGDGEQDEGEVSHRTGTNDDVPEQPRKLLFVRTFDESLVKIAAYETDIHNPRYGLPTYYNLQMVDPRTAETAVGTGADRTTRRVHWSRVIHVADNRKTSEVWGVPRMKQVYNRLMDIRKVAAGSGEMFWKGAFPGLSFEMNPDLVDPDMDREQVREEFEAYSNGLQRYLAVMGLTTKSLAPQVADPTPHVNMFLRLIAVAMSCPWRVFLGSEEAKLASDEDTKAWNGRVKRRREKYLTPMLVCPMIDRLIAVQVLPPPEEGYTTEWPDLDAPSDQSRADLAAKTTEALAKYVAGRVNELVPEREFLTLVMEFTDEETEQIIKAVQKRAKELEAEQAEQLAAMAEAAAAAGDQAGQQPQGGPPGGPPGQQPKGPPNAAPGQRGALPGQPPPKGPPVPPVPPKPKTPPK